MKFSAIILFVLFFSQVISAEERIYLSPAGNDTHAGTQNQPLASFEGVRNKIRNMRAHQTIKDTIFVEIAPGNYSITHPIAFTEEDTGTEQSPVVFCGNAENRPIVSGGKLVNNFEEVSFGLWRAYIPEVVDYGYYFEQLYVNGERRFRARTPNRDEFFHPKRVEETRLDKKGVDFVNTYGSQRLVVDNDGMQILKDIEESEWNDALVVSYLKWATTYKHIQYAGVADSSFYFVGGIMPSYNVMNKETRYFVENYKKALDQPGEWFLQRDGYLYYMPKEGETIEKTECVYPISQKLLTITGKENKKVSNIQFRNIRFEHSSYITPRNGYEARQAAATVEASVMVNHADRIEFFNCDIAHTGEGAIWFKEDCSNSRIERSHLYDLGAGGVKIGDFNPKFLGVDSEGLANTHHITIHNNIIQHGGYVNAEGIGVTVFYASDNTITHNDVADFKYSGMSVGWVWGYAKSPTKRNTVEFNHIHHLGWGQLSDMGGVYTLGASEGTTVSNNVIHHVHSYTYGGWGLYTDEGSAGIKMENNLVYKCKCSAFHQHYGKDNIIRNNIFALNLLSQLQLTRVEDHLSFTLSNNIIYYDEGLLYMDMGIDAWLDAQTVLDRNCFWNPVNQKQEFHGLSFSEWKKLGKDKHSIIADPMFVDPMNFDFRFKNTKTAQKIGFKPFDFSRAGVYGDKKWIEKALLSKDLEDKFDVVMKLVK
ncbi:right-handed parallel beta-helix repeat-containing protein [uncultured Parabacteroides sp.]|uniref:right-handed parallel beta-helix repeat-containing protein n=1 Tax=uncultured Parabacteroides sp. TaxID=512312 RepID=UPI00259BEE5C|nr:right-handed parallel beta-helix repeat-containing protein [uncultured Parabacteroides sp.]